MKIVGSQSYLLHQNPDTFDIACDLLRPDCRGITVKQGRYLQYRPKNNVQYLVFYGLKMCVRYKMLYDRTNILLVFKQRRIGKNRH